MNAAIGWEDHRSSQGDSRTPRRSDTAMSPAPVDSPLQRGERGEDVVERGRLREVHVPHRLVVAS